jgi:SAM-dependent methyltransferase
MKGHVVDELALHPGDRVLHLLDRGNAIRSHRRARSVGTRVEIRADPLGGPGARLPFSDASFDAAISIHALETVPERGWALSELHRVLANDGRLVVAVWGPLEGNPMFSVLAESLRRWGGARAGAAVHWLSSLSQQDDVRALLGVAGFGDLRMTRRRRLATVTSAQELESWLLSLFPIGAAIRSLRPDEREAVASDVRRELRRWPTGIPFTTDVHTALVHRVAQLEVTIGAAGAWEGRRTARRPGGVSRPRAAR